MQSIYNNVSKIRKHAWQKGATWVEKAGAQTDFSYVPGHLGETIGRKKDQTLKTICKNPKQIHFLFRLEFFPFLWKNQF